MKRNLTKLMTLGSIALLMLSACKKDGAVVTSNGGKPGALSASSTTLVLDKSKLNDASAAITFNFTSANYGFDAAVTNTLQIDSAGDNWNKPTSVTLSSKAGSISYSTADFNAMLLKLNLKGGVTSQIKVRLQHSVSAQVAPVYSNELSMTVTPFNLISFIYVPGAYQGWNPATADSLTSATSNGIYTGIINFTAGNLEFKITPEKKWDHSYGLTGGNSVQLDGGGNIVAPAAGLTWVTLDVNAKTITFAPVTAYYSVIGDAAAGWGTDTDMKYDNGNMQWILTTALSSSGQFKIRKNHDWAISYGIPKVGADGSTLAKDNDDNIPVGATGTYKITFAPSADQATAKYTLVKQ